MTNDIPLMPNPVELTEAAVKESIQAMEEEGLKNHGLRIAITGGGCAGLQYFLDFDDLSEEPNELDFVYEQHGITILVDGFSAMHLKGTTVDYVDGLDGSGFKFQNDHFKRSCGCGSSINY